MSIKIMSQVWQEGPERQSERFVLLALADYANDAGECYPSVRAVAQKTCMSVRGVQQILRRLEADGWLKTDPQSARNGCNLYTVTPRTTCTPAPRAPRTTCTTPPHVDDIPPAPRAPEPSITINEPSKRDTNVSLVQSRPAIRKADDAKFDEFWSRYPRKVGKGAARKAYAKAVRSVDHDDLMFALSRQLASLEAKDPQYRPHPATWLNSERWNDEPEPAHDPSGHSTGRPGSGMADAFAAVAARRLARDGRG